MYWIVAFITFIYILSVHYIFGIGFAFFDIFNLMDYQGKALLIVANTLIFGQDWIMFTEIRDGTLHMLGGATDVYPDIKDALLVPQAWTLGLELCFYIIAPFVLKSIPITLILLFVSIGIKFFLLYVGIGGVDPWSYKFFPAELLLFLLGALSHRLWKPVIEGLISVYSSSLVTFFILFICGAFFVIPDRELLSVPLMLIILFSFPFLFEYQDRYRFDRKIGELSYPIYVSHMIVITIGSPVLKKLFNMQPHGIYMAVSLVVITVLFAIFLTSIVGNFVERLRSFIKLSQARS